MFVKKNKMKYYYKFSLIMILLVSVLNASSQNEPKYLFEKSKLTVSAFGAPYAEFSMLNDQFAFTGGGGAALIFNNSFFIGGYGAGLVTHHYRNDMDTSVLKYLSMSMTATPRISFRHGGVWLGYAYKANSLVHAAISAKIGWGNISIFDPNTDPNYEGNKAQDRVMVITPQVELELNLTPWLRLNIGAGYRVIAGIDKAYRYKDSKAEIKYYNSKDFNSPVGTISLFIGGFTKKPKQ